MNHIIFLILLALVFPFLTPAAEFLLITLSVGEIVAYLCFIALAFIFPVQTGLVLRNDPDIDNIEHPNVWGDNIICIFLLAALYAFNKDTLFCYMIVQMFACNIYHQVELLIDSIKNK